MKALTDSSIVRQSPECIAANVGAEMVLMTLQTGLYLSLDEIAADIWKRLSAPICVCDLADALEQDYDSTVAELRSDLLTALQQLADAGVIEVEP